MMFSRHRKARLQGSDRQQHDYILGFHKEKVSEAKPAHHGVSGDVLSGSIPSSSPPGDDPGHIDLCGLVQRAITAFDRQARVDTLDSSDFTTSLVGIQLSEEALQRAAESLHLDKITKSGMSLPFRKSLVKLFPVSSTGSCFTLAERVRLTASILEDIPIEAAQPGGEAPSIADLLSLGTIQGLPLHKQSDLNWLHTHWVQNVADTFSQPLDHIAAYFGEKIAFYFAWLQFYSVALLTPTVLGLILFAYQHYSGRVESWPTVLFSLCMAVWGTVTMKVWKRQQSCLAYDWAVLGYEATETVRPQHAGKPFMNPVTHKMEKAEPMWQHLLRFALATVPGMLILVAISCAYMVACDRLTEVLDIHLDPKHRYNGTSAVGALGLHNESMVQELQELVLELAWVKSATPGDLWALPGWAKSGLGFLPTILFVTGISILDILNTKVARMLSDFENHRTDEEYENSLIGKQALLQFLNNFMSLFYIAFVRQDLDLLRERLTFLLVWRALLNNVQEVALPMLKSDANIVIAKVQGSRKFGNESAPSPPSHDKGGSPPVAESSGLSVSSSLTAAQMESKLEKYDTFDDMLEMFVQFGHVTLFAAIFPLAPLFALLNNVIEVHSDAFKICSMQRPFPARSASLGAWTGAFEAVGYVAVASNVALFGVASYQAEALGNLAPHYFVLVCVLLEHALIMLKVLLESQVGNIPAFLRRKVLVENKARTVFLSRVIQSSVVGANTTGFKDSPLVATPEAQMVPTKASTLSELRRRTAGVAAPSNVQFLA
jgi:anoctamin-10